MLSMYVVILGTTILLMHNTKPEQLDYDIITDENAIDNSLAGKLAIKRMYT
jgi:hypothetical protein